MAEVLLSDAVPCVTVSSAGTAALAGNPADEIAMRLMAERGKDISNHRARQLDRRMCQDADLILVMDKQLRFEIEARYIFSTGKVFRLCEHSGLDVPDPFRGTREVFERSLKLLDIGVEAWAERLKKIQ